MSAKAVLHAEWFALVERRVVRVEATRQVVWMHAIRPAIPQFCFDRSARKSQPGLIELRAALVESRHPEHDWRRVGEEPEPLFALPQRSQSACGDGDVCDQPQEAAVAVDLQQFARSKARPHLAVPQSSLCLHVSNRGSSFELSDDVSSLV